MPGKFSNCSIAASTSSQNGWILGWQLATRAISFFGTAWMARCLGPSALGISAVVLAASNFVGLFCNLGLSLTGAREIAIRPHQADSTVQEIVGIRLRAALILGCLWLVATPFVTKMSAISGFAWLAGASLVFVNALNTSWVLQGLENLPLQSRVTAGAGVASALAYWVFFRPGAQAGSDLVVLSAVGLLSLLLTWRYVIARTRARIFARLDYSQALRRVSSGKHAFGTTLAIYVFGDFNTLLVGALASSGEAGFLRAAATLATPVAMIATLSDQLLYPRLASWWKQGPEVLLLRKWAVVKLYIVVATGTLVLTAVLAKPMIRLVLGPAFGQVVVPFILVVCGRLLAMISGVFRWALLAAGEDRELFKLSATVAFLSIALSWVLVAKYGAIGAGATIVWCESLSLGLAWWRCSRCLRRSKH